jgi:hypothetical protein
MEVGPLPKLPRGAAVFPSPYDTISKFTYAKNLVLCDDVLYQVWRRPTGAGNTRPSPRRQEESGGGSTFLRATSSFSWDRARISLSRRAVFVLYRPVVTVNRG